MSYQSYNASAAVLTQTANGTGWSLAYSSGNPNCQQGGWENGYPSATSAFLVDLDYVLNQHNVPSYARPQAVLTVWMSFYHSAVLDGTGIGPAQIGFAVDELLPRPCDITGPIPLTVQGFYNQPRTFQPAAAQLVNSDTPFDVPSLFSAQSMQVFFSTYEGTTEAGLAPIIDGVTGYVIARTVNGSDLPGLDGYLAYAMRTNQNLSVPPSGHYWGARVMAATPNMWGDSLGIVVDWEVPTVLPPTGLFVKLSDGTWADASALGIKMTGGRWVHRDDSGGTSVLYIKSVDGGWMRVMRMS